MNSVYIFVVPIKYCRSLDPRLPDLSLFNNVTVIYYTDIVILNSTHNKVSYVFLLYHE